MPSGCSSAGEIAAYTRNLVSDAFIAENTAGQAQRDPTRLTMSWLGGCTRAAAYAAAGTPASDVPPEQEARAAVLGTRIHEWMLPVLAGLAGPRSVFEQRVRLTAAGLVIGGSLDLADDTTVWDVKSVGEHRLHGVRRTGAYADHRLQVMGYALARWQAGYKVRWVVWIYLDRATGDTHIEVEEFTNAAALAVVDRIQTIRWHADDEPDAAPREGRGPGLSYACDSCPWLRRCWGDAAVPGQPGAQTSAAQTSEGVEAALSLYSTAAAAGAAARADQQFAKLVLSATPDGVYGGWRLARGRPGTQIDQERVQADYALRGQEPPKTPTAGRMIVRATGQEG